MDGAPSWAHYLLFEPLATPPEHLEGFPAYVLPVGASLYRAHRAHRSPWWSSSDGSGRFDLPLPAGTCYMAEEPLAALLETARGLTLLSEEFLAGRRLFSVSLPAPFRLADLTAPAAYGFGVTAELSATTDYTAPRAWAQALRRAGFDGIRYHVRHDPRSMLTGTALFGRAGRAKNAPRGRSHELPAHLLLAAAPFGIRVAGPLPPER